MANVELLKSLKAAVLAKPEFWDQHKWAAVPIEVPGSLVEFEEGEGLEVTCGTTMCLAGWTCHLSGEKIDWTKIDVDEFNGTTQYVAHKLKSGESIENRAIELLDIDYDDSAWLFYAYDKEEALERLDQLIENGCITDPYRNDDED